MWDLLSCSVWWSYTATIKTVAVHPHRPALAVVVQADLKKVADADGEDDDIQGDIEPECQHSIILFGDASASPIPTAVWPLSDAAESITFVPTTGTWSTVDMSSAAPMNILVMSVRLELSLLIDKEHISTVISGSKTVGRSEDVSVFDATFGTAQQNGNSEAKSALSLGARQQKKQEGGFFGSAPSHAMPALTKMFGKFIAQMLPKKRDTDDLEHPPRVVDKTDVADPLCPTASSPATGSSGKKRMLKDITDPDALYEEFWGGRARKM